MSETVRTSIELESLQARIRERRQLCEQFGLEQRQRWKRLRTDVLESLEQLATQHSEWDEMRSQIARASLNRKREQAAIDRSRAELNAQRLDLEERTLETNDQRKRIAQKFLSKRHDSKSMDGRIREYESTIFELKERLANAENTEVGSDPICIQLQTQLDEAQQSEQKLRRKAAEGVRVANERGQQIIALREEIAQLSQSAADTEPQVDREQRIERLKQERDDLRSQVEQLQQNLDRLTLDESARSNVEGQSRRKDAIRSLRKQWEQAEPTEENCDWSDWETRKNELMAQLTGETLGDASEKQELQAAISNTDRVVAAKDAKIEELQERLENLVNAIETERSATQNHATVLATGASSEALPTPTQQSEVHSLQEEWQAKMREAEVEIAVQRAEFARRRAELEEKARDIEAQLANAKKQAAIRSESKRKGWLGR